MIAERFWNLARASTVGLVLLAAPTSALAQPPLEGLAVVPWAATAAEPADCSDGVRHDDGTFEEGLRASFPLKIVSRFDLLAESNAISRVCVCWRRGTLFGGYSFDVVVFDDDGPDGLPGTLLGRESVEVDDIPAGAGTFFGFDLSSLGITVDRGSVYVGIDSLPLFESQPHLCTDNDGPGAPSILAAPTGSSSDWQEVREQLPDLGALGVRLRFEAMNEPSPQPGTCTPGPRTLCIDDEPGDGRFEIEVDYETVQGGGSSGPGSAIPLGSLDVRRGGLFWFFNPTNPEMLIKVLNGCSVNGHYWVFYSAGTNVGLTVRVRDLATGRTFVSSNPDRRPAPPVQATSAFPCE